jgi:hypothetical protein
MIHPTCAEVLATMLTGFEDQIVPHLHDREARSAAATFGHLLRHVALRVDAEGQILLDDIIRLRHLVGTIADWFESEGTGDAKLLRESLPRELPSNVYPTLTLLGEQALTLRGALVAVQLRLQQLTDTHGSNPGYQALRRAIRDYIASQLADEAKLIDTAFLGKGPRR